MASSLLMVIPPTVRLVDGRLEVESDYANNLRAYLEHFDYVTFACPIAPEGSLGILRSLSFCALKDADRLSYVRLPYTYREDRHLLQYLSTRKILLSEISKATHLLFSPHAKYDWATLGARLAMKMGRKYCIESDWDHRSVGKLQLREMPLGAKKIRKSLWARSFNRQVDSCMAHSSLALLQGQEVYDAYKDIAPNAKKVLNVQVSPEDQISFTELNAKLRRAKNGEPLEVVYAGRMIEMKGPIDWLMAIRGALEQGANLRAVWFGDGPLMIEMRSLVGSFGLSGKVSLGGVLNREELMLRLRRAHIFLFCHKAGESPRCLSEALASGCPLVGYEGAFPRDLVAIHGGGEFVRRGDWKTLASTLVTLDRDRPRLTQLIKSAAASGKEFDRNAAIKRRIDLIKINLGVN